MNSETTTSSNEVTKANSAPASTPGRISGKVTERKVVQADAPRLAEARSRVRSKPVRAAVTFTVTNGNASTVCATTKPVGVPISPQPRNAAYIATATTMPGTISGARNSPSIAPLPAKRVRDSAKAAMVPSTVATTVTIRASWSDTSSEVSQLDSVKN